MRAGRVQFKGGMVRAADSRNSGAGTKGDAATSEEEKQKNLLFGTRVDIAQLLDGYFPIYEEDVINKIDDVEHIPNMIRPVVCHLHAPTNWMVLRTYVPIIEMRESIRTDDRGNILGDRDFKRCKLHALHLIAKKTATTVAAREKIYRDAFRLMFDKLWHRYLLPFGTIVYQIDANPTSKTEKLFKDQLKKSAGSATSLHINEFSVATGDILYLCNTHGYIDRFIELVNIILDAKESNCNLLEHRRRNGNEWREMSMLDRFYTLEKHLHLCGSLWLHREVIKQLSYGGGNWKDILQRFDSLYNTTLAKFQMKQAEAEMLFRLVTLQEVNCTNITQITAFFPSASHPVAKSK